MVSKTMPIEGQPPDVEVSLSVDTQLFPENVVLKACYAFTARCFIDVARDGAGRLALRFRPRLGSRVDAITDEFRNELIDQRVREDVARETRAIREFIVAQAFAEADLPAMPMDPA